MNASPKMSDEKERIATSRQNMGDLEFSRNEFGAALSLYHQVYEIRKGLILNGSELNACMSAFNVGKCLHCLGDHDAALQFYHEFIHSILTSSDLKLLTLETVLVIQKIGWAFYQDSLFRHGRYFYELALWSANNVLFGENHEVVVRILNQIGNLSFDSHDMESAIEFYERGLKIESSLQETLESWKGPQFQNTLVTLSNLARAYEKIGCFHNSLKASQTIVETLKSYDGTKPDIATSSLLRSKCSALFDMARVQTKLGRPELALEALSEVLHHSRNENIQVAIAFSEIGIIHGKEGRTDLAIKSFERSLNIRKALDDSKEQEYSVVLWNLARAHVDDYNFTKALHYFKELCKVEIFKRKKSQNMSNNYDPLILLNALEQMIIIFNEELHWCPRNALACCKKAIGILGKEPSPSFPIGMHSRFLGMAGNACVELRDMKKAMTFYTNVMRINLLVEAAPRTNITPSSTTRYRILKSSVNIEKLLPSSCAPAA